MDTETSRAREILEKDTPEAKRGGKDKAEIEIGGDLNMTERIKIKCGVFEDLMIRNEKHPLHALANAKSLPILTSYAISELIQRIATKNRPFMEQREKLLIKYCDRDEKGNPVLIQGGKAYQFSDPTSFMNEMEALMAIEVDLEMDKIPIRLESIPEAILSPNDFIHLKAFFDIQVGKKDGKQG